MTDETTNLDSLPNLVGDQFPPIDLAALFDAPRASHPPAW